MVLHRPRFATDKKPLNSLELQSPNRTEMRLNRKTLNPRVSFSEIVDPIRVFLVFDGDAHPDVRGPVELTIKREKLRLERMHKV